MNKESLKTSTGSHTLVTEVGLNFKLIELQKPPFLLLPKLKIYIGKMTPNYNNTGGSVPCTWQLEAF